MISSFGRFLRHLREWRAVLAEEGQAVTWRTWLKMLRGVIGIPASARVWRQRARVCLKCPIYDRELRRCRGPWIQNNPTGCGCYVPWLLRVRRPYLRGCWGRQFGGPTLGWGVEDGANAPRLLDAGGRE